MDCQPVNSSSSRRESEKRKQQERRHDCSLGPLRRPDEGEQTDAGCHDSRVIDGWRTISAPMKIASTTTPAGSNERLATAAAAVKADSLAIVRTDALEDHGFSAYSSGPPLPEAAQ